jgi:hypothetical protein
MLCCIKKPIPEMMRSTAARLGGLIQILGLIYLLKTKAGAQKWHSWQPCPAEQAQPPADNSSSTTSKRRGLVKIV